MLTTSDGRRLKIFDDGIVVNKELPKWKNSKKRVELKREQQRKDEGDEPKKKEGNIYFTQVDLGTTSTNSSSFILNTNNNMLIQETVNEEPVTPNDYDQEKFNKANFDEAAKMAIKDLTDFINEKGVSTIFGNVYSSNWGNTVSISANGGEPEKKQNWLGKLIEKLTTKKEGKEVYSLSVLDFFENIKLIGKGSAETYKDRVMKYLEALHTAEITGQEALKQKLVREMFVNKYEAELYANGYYYVVTEKQVLDFAKQTEKGVDLIYLKNFARPLPEKVVKKLIALDNLEVFDNYAILTYDPEKKDKIETEAERAKRKDPILFGLISGSDKLYYITDWIDDYCDLTLAQFVDTLGIKKKDLKME